MKDYCEIEEHKYEKHYLNENNRHHRLTGPAVEWLNGSKSYYINNIYYMGYNNYYNKLVIYTQILKLDLEYEKYIKQNIKDLIQEYNPKLILSNNFEQYKINELPIFIKNLIII